MDFFGDEAKNLWKYAPIVALLLIALWAGFRGYWHFGPGVRLMISRLEMERNEWRRIALDLLARQGVRLSDTVDPVDLANHLKNSEKPKPD